MLERQILWCEKLSQWLCVHYISTRDPVHEFMHWWGAWSAGISVGAH